ncbi:putative inorganic phosphate cotransporter [Armadillidium vulgare]|nr:putative inorganic phosphate cotransporter [Armadillidium vulgare]
MQESNTDVNEESDSHSDATGSGQQNIDASNENQSVPNLSKARFKIFAPPKEFYERMLLKFAEWIATRHIFAFLGFLGFANVYAMRVNLSVAIVAMVNSSAIPQRNSTSDDVCPLPTNGSITPVKVELSGVQICHEEGKFDWDESVQGIILGSFFWGYIVTNPIGGRLGDIFGGKKVFFFGVLFTSLLTLLIPLASYISPYALTALRVCIGLAEHLALRFHDIVIQFELKQSNKSKTHFIIIQFITSLAPPTLQPRSNVSFNEFNDGKMDSSTRTKSNKFLYFCRMAQGKSEHRFKTAFSIDIHESPSTHPRISPEEKLYINSSLRTNKAYFKKMPLPFKEIITSVPFWAILAAHVCQNWGYYFLLTELPTYMKNILHFDIKAVSDFIVVVFISSRNMTVT